MWINQPSTLQKFHALHGTNVLAGEDYGDTMKVYFLSGDVISAQVSKRALCEGWYSTGEQPQDEDDFPSILSCPNCHGAVCNECYDSVTPAPPALTRRR
jgi:hypothetical protein